MSNEGIKAMTAQKNPYPCHCVTCQEAQARVVAEAERDQSIRERDEAQKRELGYYGKASEGWTKFRAAEKALAETRADLQRLYDAAGCARSECYIMCNCRDEAQDALNKIAAIKESNK